MSTKKDTSEPSFTKIFVVEFKRCLPALALTSLTFKIFAFIVLAPLFSLLINGMIVAFGKATLSDIDILVFFLGPYGCLCLILLGAIWLAILVLEQAALIAIVYARSADQHLHPISALRYSAANAWLIFRVTTRFVVHLLVYVAPLIAISAVVYQALLTEYDINYYLKEKPPVFVVALGIGVLLVTIMIALLCRLFTSWFFALPLVLFEEVKPHRALQMSRKRVQGQRRKVMLWIITWFIATTLVSMTVTTIVTFIGRLIIPTSTASLQILAVTIGVILLLWALTALVTNLFSTTTFAVLMIRLYQQMGRKEDSQHVHLPAATDTIPALRFQITRTRILVGTIIGFMAASAVSIFALKSIRLEDDVTIMAHRGSSKSAPENTLAAIKQAIEDGADWVEIDVQETADGEVVVFHDSDFMKLAGCDLKIWDARIQDLKVIDIGSWFDQKFQDERVPTLEEVLLLCRNKIGVNIELKYYGHDKKLEQRVSSIVESCDMSSQVKAMSLKIDGVKKMKALQPDWNVGLLMSVSAGKVKNIEADFLAVNASFIKRSMIQAAHENEKDVYVWTINDAQTMSKMISYGVDGILTDQPALARLVLRQRAEMSVPERLLLEIARMLGGDAKITEQ